jgi:flavin reductase (DIM6/NTAB) family NADH-FMN oxidoreductase RutF
MMNEQIALSLQADFRTSMRRLAATVSIITCEQDGNPVGITVTSVSSLSMDPPSLLACINRGASLHPALRCEADICVNLLSNSQVEICEAFSGRFKPQDRFLMGDWGFDGSAPYLRGAQANIFCRIDNLVDYASHTIVLARVLHVYVERHVQPLVYLDGRYPALAD